jgi:hypothetical protein
MFRRLVYQQARWTHLMLVMAIDQMLAAFVSSVMPLLV